MKTRWTMLFCILLTLLCAVASADVPLTEQYFPDKNFRDILSQETYDIYPDGVLSGAELAKIKVLSVESKNISDLTGIEYLTSLTTLNIKNNHLTQVNLSANTELNTLYCDSNALQQLDLRANAKLQYLYCSRNPFTQLDVSSNRDLRHLECESGQLTVLNVSGADKLETIRCDSNQLITLDVSGNKSLKTLKVSHNQLTSLKVNGASSLTLLECKDNRLTGLDVSALKLLDTLQCDHNELSSLYINGAEKLRLLGAYNNRLQVLDLSGSPTLASLNVNFNELTSLDLSKTVVGINGFLAADNAREIWLNQKGEFDLSTLAGFNGTKASAWTGGSVSGTMLKAYDSAEYATYTYDCGRDHTAAFRLVYHREAAPSLEDTFVVRGLKYKVITGSTVRLLGLEKKSSMTTVTIPDAVVTPQGTYTVTEIAAKALKSDRKIETLSIGKKVRAIGKSAFAGCTKLKTVKGGAAVTAILDNAFSGCKVLKSFPAMGRLKAIGANAFKSCAKLTKFTLGEAVQSIGKNAFNGCKALKTITVKTTRLTGSNVKDGAFKGIYKKATIRCPKKQLKAYQKLFVKKGAPKTCKFK